MDGKYKPIFRVNCLTQFFLHIQANVSPAMGCMVVPVEHLDPNHCMNLLYNAFRVMGIASSYDFHSAR